MGLGPNRPSTSGGATTNKDPRLDTFLAEMPINGLFVKNSQDHMQGIGVDASTIVGLVNANVPSMIASAEVEISRKADSSSLVMKADVSSLVSKADSSSLVNYAFKSSVEALQSTLNNKLDASSQISLDRVTGLSSSLSAKLDASSNIDSSKVSGLSQLLSGKADSSGLVSVSQALVNKADSSSLTSITQNLANKIDASGVSAAGKSGSYADLTNKPASFPPSTHTHPISDIVGLQNSLNAKLDASGAISYNNLNDKPAIPTTVAQLTDASAYAKKSDVPSLNYPITSVNTKTGAVVLNAADVSAAAIAHTHQISDVSGLSAIIANKADSSSVAKVRYYTATSDASSIWTVNLGTDFAQVLDVQAVAQSTANTVGGVRQASLNAYTATSTSVSGITFGGNILTTVLISAGANGLSLFPNTVVKVRVEGR